MRIERPATITITAASDALAVRHAERVMKAPDPRWNMGIPHVIARRGTQRTVRVMFTLDRPD